MTVTHVWDQVSPAQDKEPSPRSPRLVKFSPSFNEKISRSCSSVGEDKTICSPPPTKTAPTVMSAKTAPTVISPPSFRQIKTIKPLQQKSPPSKSPSPQAHHYKTFTTINRLSNISENVIFMECS